MKDWFRHTPKYPEPTPGQVPMKHAAALEQLHQMTELMTSTINTYQAGANELLQEIERASAFVESARKSVRSVQEAARRMEANKAAVLQKIRDFEKGASREANPKG